MEQEDISTVAASKERVKRRRVPV